MATVYRSTVTSKTRVANLMATLNAFSDSDDPTDTDNVMYMTIGRAQPWADNELDSTFVPPQPVDTPAGHADAWNRFLGLIRIYRHTITPVIARRDWGDDRISNGRQYFIGDVVVTNTITGINKHPTADAGYMVYMCVDVPDEGVCSITQITEKEECLNLGGVWSAAESPATSLDMIPHGKGSSIDTKDGYRWQYLYTIPAALIETTVSDEYIPVPTPDQAMANPSEWGIENVVFETPDHGKNIIHHARCYTLLYKGRMDDRTLPETAVPGNTGYRQVCMITNPLQKKNSPTDPDLKCVTEIARISDLDEHSGDIIYIENRQPIFRSSDQVEEFSIVMVH